MRPASTFRARWGTSSCARRFHVGRGSILTEIYLCHASSSHEIEDGNGRQAHYTGVSAYPEFTHTQLDGRDKMLVLPCTVAVDLGAFILRTA
jgi:hypothetical protein